MLIVEDGTGLANADSYLSLAEATDVFNLYGVPEGWDDLDEADQEIALRVATLWVDLEVSFYGSRLTREQALSFPRTSFVDTAGVWIEAGTIPFLLKKAVAYAAVVQTETPLSSVSEKKVKSESWGSSSISYSNSVSEGVYGTKIKPLLKILSRYGTLSTYKARIVRS